MGKEKENRLTMVFLGLGIALLVVILYALFWQKPATGIRFLSASSSTDPANTLVPNIPTFRLMTFNIKHAARRGGGTDIGAVARVISESQADIVSLQEVDKNQLRSAFLDQGAWLARELGMNAVFGPAIDRGFGQYGNLLLSRFPILSARTLSLPSRLEPRSAIIARVVTPAGHVTLLVTHLGLSYQDRADQINAILGELAKEPPPYILMGDWNASIGQGEMTSLTAAFRALPENDDFTFFPANGGSPAAIDRIFVSRDLIVTSAKIVKDVPVSDHLPLIIEVLGRGIL